MSKMSLMWCAVCSLGGIAAGCGAEESPASAAMPRAVDPLTEELAADQSVARTSVAEDPDPAGNLQAQRPPDEASVAVTYVIEPSGATQAIARAGLEPATKAAPLPEAPGAMRRPLP